MGNRDDLLAGAKRVLAEKGYARVTARDIAAASGTSLAAIGYHFGTKEALLKVALLELSGARLGDQIEEGLEVPGREAALLDRFESMWAFVLGAFPGQRELLASSLENLAQVPRVEDVREVMVTAYQGGVEELARLLRKYESSLSEHDASNVARFCYVLMTGLVAQWFTDPATCPTAADLSQAVATLATTPPP
jgi:AcrR family transcriptional regulator